MSYRRVTVSLLAACLALVVAGVGFLDHVRGPSSLAQRGSGDGGILSDDVDAGWKPQTTPFQIGGGQEATEAQALAQATSEIDLPALPVAADSSLTHAWWISIPPTDGLLPTVPRTSVAFAYQSGVQIIYDPWQYGATATFSQTQNRAYFQVQSSQLPGIISVDTVAGIPVGVIPSNAGGAGGPGSIEFELGTQPSDAVQITVLGRLSTAELEAVAASIIGTWEAAHP